MTLRLAFMGTPDFAVPALRALVAAGHEGLGVTTALGTAQMITDIVLGRSSAVDRAAFDPRRLEAAHD